MKAIATVVLAANLALAIGCGARSQLRIPTPLMDGGIDGMDGDVGTSRESGPLDVLSLCLHFGDVVETVDAAVADAGPECTSDRDCATVMGRPICDLRLFVCTECRVNTDCPRGQECASGTCASPCVRGACPGTTLTCCNGACVDLSSTRSNCGACGTTCPIACEGGVCVGACRSECQPGDSCCAGSCVNLQLNASSCGDCNTRCPTNMQCLGGRCVPSNCSPQCVQGTNCCGSVCANLLSSTLHCGSCTHACAPGWQCTNGVCEAPCSHNNCVAGQACCGGDCVDVTRDPLNCGRCANECDVGEACVGSTCTPVGRMGVYSVAPSSQPFINACATNVPHNSYLAGVDDVAVPITLPFPFTFFGCSDRAAWISSNGVLGIGSAPSNEYNNLCLPNRFAPRATILAFWDDIVMRDGVCTTTTGMPGSQLFVVEWRNAYFYAANMDADLDFEVVLHEGTNLIDVVYQTMTDGTEPGRGSGTQATIGIVDAFGAGALQYGCNQPVIHAPQAIRFAPAP